jgi:hypothetical protein
MRLRRGEKSDRLGKCELSFVEEDRKGGRGCGLWVVGCGLVGWRVGRLVDWWIVGLMGWWVGGLMWGGGGSFGFE